MPPEDPLVTIVTPTLNAGRFLAETIDSVLCQDYPNLEYLVVDGHSTDDTLDILGRNAGRLRVIQAPPAGPAAAIHAGFSQARGSILAWLNADDKYSPGAFRTAVKTLAERPGTDVVYGDGVWIDEHGGVIRPYPTIPFSARELARDCFICQPAAFFRASAYRECALDPALKVSFDYDLWIRLALQQRRFDHIPHCLAYSRMHRDNITLARRREVFEGGMELLKRHYGYIPLPWILNYLAYLRDGRDQFFAPVQFSARVWLASLPHALARNPGRPLRVAGEWTSLTAQGLRNRLLRLWKSNRP